MDLELGGSVMLVTGGSDGVGLALCRRLVEEGAKVALCARNPERLATAADELRAAGGEIQSMVADVTRPQDLSRFVEEAVGRFGRIDGLVNNAGRASAGPVADSDDATWQEDYELKVLAAVRASRLVLPYLRAKGGSIVNVLAISAKTPAAGSAPTSVSRAAGVALTKALSKEVGPLGVRVNAVLIGFIESGQWVRRAAASGTELATFYRQLAESSGIPLGRVGRGAEFADLVAFLLSPRAAYVSGTAINLDGGLSPAV